MFLVGLCLASFFSLWHFAWTAVVEEVKRTETFAFSADRLAITPKPPWIHEDITKEALISASLDGTASLMDDDLTERISGAFALQPWVAEVLSVRKRYPGKVEVKLQYLGKPIAMVEIPSELCPGNIDGGLYPIDAEGHLLPTGYFIREARTEASTDYLRLRGIRSLPDGPEGSVWDDPRIRQGAVIAAALAPHRQDLEVTHLVIEKVSGGDSDGVTTKNRYALLTRYGTRVHWGTYLETEAIVLEKAKKQVERLLRRKREKGMLDRQPGASVTVLSPVSS
jgi:hypothetical protein